VLFSLMMLWSKRIFYTLLNAVHLFDSWKTRTRGGLNRERRLWVNNKLKEAKAQHYSILAESFGQEPFCRNATLSSEGPSIYLSFTCLTLF
jgi:hypothetical protein